MTATRSKTSAGSIPTEAKQTGPRRFEFVAGNSAKFWEIEVRGSEVTVRYGRIGTHGQTRTKDLADQAAAQRHAEKLIAEKTKKGYEEVTPNE